MLFNSLSFLFVFLPITVLGFHLLGRFGRRPVIAWLTAASLVFYAVWNPAFVLFLIGSVVVNYAVAYALAEGPPGSPARNHRLVLGIALNLIALFYFKYLYKTLLLVGALHLADLHPHPILLPLGISFFTFTQISYLVDLAQGQAERQDLLSYALFVTFFPHLIAGPILHHKEMMPQFSAVNPTNETRRRFRLVPADVTVGLSWFLLGLAKKVLLADRLAATADLTFAHAGAQTAASAWTGLIVYSMQLYFDFSGYSDMALGLARIFSIRFPINFDSPYKALSVTEYWQRWHITLTRYITLYLYNPMLLAVQRRRMAAGKKTSRKVLRTPAGFTAMIAYPTLVTMLLTGLWHGAGLQFLVFGGIHGVYLTANQAWRHFRKPDTAHPGPPPTAPRRLALMIAVYLQVTFALIFFRSSSLPSAFALIADLAGRHGLGHLDTLANGALAFALFPIVWFFPNTQTILGQEPATERALAAQALTRPSANPAIAPAQPNPATLPAGPIEGQARTPILSRLRWQPNLAWALVLAALFFATLANLDTNVPFLYFQF